MNTLRHNRTIVVVLTIVVAATALGFACERTEPAQQPLSTSAEPLQSSADRNAAALRTAVERHAIGTDLPPDAAQQLGEQTGDIAKAWLGGDIAQYDAAMQTVGGRFLYDLADPSPSAQRSAARQRECWYGLDSDLGITFFDQSRATVEVASGAARHIEAGPEGMRVVPSRYRFGTSTKELDNGNNPIARVTVPVMTRGGQEYQFTYVFIWSPERQVWVPEHLRILGGEAPPPFYF